MSAPTTILDLEEQIGHPSGQSSWKYADIQKLKLNLAHRFEDPSTRATIQKWMIAKGVPERKAYAASDYVLHNAFCGGDPYLRKMVQGDDPQRRRRNAGIAIGDLHQDLLDQPLDQPNDDAIRAAIERNLEEKAWERALPVKDIDESKIAAAADKVIGTRLDAAKRELRQEVEHRVTIAVEALKLSETTKDTIRHIAMETSRAVAEQIISEQLPRRLEIITRDKTKILDATPRHEKFDEILFWLSIQKHVYMVGPRGTGKTHLFRQLAEALDLGDRFFPIGQTLTKYELSGHTGPTGEYVGTLLRNAIEFGGFVAVDEGDTWAAAAMVFLNTPLANRYCAFPDKVVPVHPDFRCAIAANTYGSGATRQYQGRNPLDAASLDRFAFVEVEYDENLEKQLYGNGPWVQYCHRVRKAATELGSYEAVPSMRGIEMCVDAASANGSADMIAQAILWKGLAPDTVQRIKSLAGEPPNRLRVVGEVA